MSTLGTDPASAGATRAASARPGLLGRLRRFLIEPAYPLVALEVRPRSIGAVRLVRERRGYGLGSAASVSLPEGVLGLSMAQPNVVDLPAFQEAVRSVLERAGIPLEGTIGLVLPDPVARISLLPASELLGKDTREAEEMIRFRLRKAVPFDIKESRVAYQLPLSRSGEAHAVAVVVARPVLDGYEDALAGLGLQVGVVELAGLAILSAVEASEPPADRLVVNWDDGYVSLLLSRDSDPVLVRTLAGDAAGADEDIIREVANTVMYYREKLGGAGLASVVVRCAALPPGQAVDLLREPLGLVPQVLDPWAPVGGSDEGPTGQAVAGAAACVVGKVL